MGYSYNPTGSHSVTVYIQTTDPSGAPTGAPPPASPLTSADGLVPADPAWAPFVFPTPIGIASGATYAIVFVTHSPNAIYYAGPYAGSKTWSYDGSWASHDFQFAFQTFLGAATAAPPTVAMAFGAASIPVGGTTSLTYTITNPNAATAPVVRPALPGPGALTNIAFTDTLPAGLLIATPNNIGGGCGGAITATAGTSLVSITGLTLAAGASCGFGVDVIGTTAGTKNNATTAITSSEAGVGNSASASIVVAAPAAPTPAPTAAPTATPTAAPTATHTAAPTATPPTTSTVDHRGPGNEAPLLLFLVLTAIAGLLLTWLLLRPESRVRRR